MTTAPLRHRRSRWLVAIAMCAATSTGCTSAITSAYLRDGWLDAVERSSPEDDDRPLAPRRPGGPGDGGDAGDGGSDAEGGGPEPAAAPLSLDDAVAVAEKQLETTGGLSPEARATLVGMLGATPPQDWPVVVEEFALAMAASRKAKAAGPLPAVPADAVASPDAPPPAEPPPVPTPAPSPAGASSGPAVAPPQAAAAGADKPAAEATSEGAADLHGPLAVANACFASRVRAWGVVDRFAADRFAPGQQVILYFELDHVASQESSAGHTTRVDTGLTLRGGDGTVLHEWTFDPLEETCLSRRRDYFARYVLALPAALPPGPCRLEVRVADLCSGRTATASLPLDIVGR